MKKKIKDLTIGEFIKIADKHYLESCKKCPFFNADIPCYEYCDSGSTKAELKQKLNKKVEIKDE